MKSAAVFVVVVFAIATGTSPLDAQVPDKFTNLQVFPANTPPDVLTAAMKNITRALGVRCPFCHVGEEGMPLEKFDFAADIKPQKQIARDMMLMTAEINGRVGKVIPAAPANNYHVTCWTCHRGSQHPQHVPPR